MKEWMPWQATKQQIGKEEYATAYTSPCRDMGAKMKTMLQHEGEHVEECEQSSKVKIEYDKAYSHVCRGMSLVTKKKK